MATITMTIRAVTVATLRTHGTVTVATETARPTIIARDRKIATRHNHNNATETATAITGSDLDAVRAADVISGGRSDGDQSDVHRSVTGRQSDVTIGAEDGILIRPTLVAQAG